ncbi:MAG TPA: hypothetical protein IAA22_02425 [Candidatus Olsenella stercoravium]|uniref:HEAT repeat domain-containing protein n=1 Tax=Candidatus Olsenella stercoravium TaxID=2838713 RepID=A0A9D2IPF5_9ACTN|nr:hypothetical protein [Candidatus Olsenella stercoravium]
MADTDDTQVAGLVEELSGASRRRRQEVAHQLALSAKAHPQIMLPHVDALVDALYRPEAQTRWEVLDALSAVADVDADAVAEAYDGAEASLFDDGSATVRLAAFVFLCRLGASSPERSDQVWQLLDEAIQCYHGDAEYRDMLVALLGLARGDASEATKQALAARVRFDAESGSGYIKTFSAEILQAIG